MQKKIIIFILAAVTLIAFCLTHSKDALAGGSNDRPGWYIGIGPMMGFELDAIKSFGGGLTGPFGYHFGNSLSLYMQSDIYYTRDSGVNYLITSFIPSFKYDFHEGFYAYLGAGYLLLKTSAGARIGSLTVTASSLYNGLTIDGGFGYDYFVNDRFSISPQIGYNYTYVASNHLHTPNLRVNFNYHF